MKHVDSYECEKMKHALYEYHHCMNEAAAKLQGIAAGCQCALYNDAICRKLLTSSMDIDSSVDIIVAQWLQVADEAKNIADTMYGGF